MSMSPQMMEILKRAKQIDKAAQKFDTGTSKKSNTAGLMAEMDGTKLISAEEAGYGAVTETRHVNTDNEGYKKAVQGSKLPPAIQRAMLETPIPQASSGFDVDEEMVREVRGISENVSTYNEDDEIDMYEKPVRRQEIQKNRIIHEEVSKPVNVDEKYLRKLISSEISKALPKIIEHYFESRLVKENVQFKAGNTIFSGSVMPMPKVKGKTNI